jgi:hypothetical protein
MGFGTVTGRYDLIQWVKEVADRLLVILVPRAVASGCFPPDQVTQYECTPVLGAVLISVRTCQYNCAGQWWCSAWEPYVNATQCYHWWDHIV